MPHALQQLSHRINCPTRFGWLKLVLISSSLAITACQSTPQQKIVTQKVATSTAATTAANRASVSPSTAKPAAYRPLPVQATGIPGLTDLKWELVSVNSKNPQPFINRPYLFLQSAAQRISGSTGCNALHGSYEMVGQKGIRIQALAGHMACNDALAQEAEIMDLLGRVNSYQLQQSMLYLYDQNGGLLLTARSSLE